MSNLIAASARLRLQAVCATAGLSWSNPSESIEYLVNSLRKKKIRVRFSGGFLSPPINGAFSWLDDIRTNAAVRSKQRKPFKHTCHAKQFPRGACKAQSNRRRCPHLRWDDRSQQRERQSLLHRERWDLRVLRRWNLQPSSEGPGNLPSQEVRWWRVAVHRHQSWRHDRLDANRNPQEDLWSDRGAWTPSSGERDRQSVEGQHERHRSCRAALLHRWWQDRKGQRHQERSRQPVREGQSSDLRLSPHGGEGSQTAPRLPFQLRLVRNLPSKSLAEKQGFYFFLRELRLYTTIKAK